jgi:hypothetical protein
MKTRKQLEKQGFQFSWGCTAFTLCVHAPDGSWLGTFSSRGAFQIPTAAREAIADYISSSAD